MTDLYRKDAGEMLRGMKLSADRRELVVQDEMKLKRPSELYWFMHTEADVEIVENGRAAILSQLDKRLYVELAEGPAGARFSVMDAAPLATSPNPDGQSSNEGMRKLTIHLEHVQDVRLSVRMVPLYASDPIPPAETEYTPCWNGPYLTAICPNRQPDLWLTVYSWTEYRSMGSVQKSRIMKSDFRLMLPLRL